MGIYAAALLSVESSDLFQGFIDLATVAFGRVSHKAHGIFARKALLYELVELAPGYLLRKRLPSQTLDQVAEVFDVLLQILYHAAGEFMCVKEFVDISARKKRCQRFAGGTHIALPCFGAGVIKVGKGLAERFACAAELQCGLQVNGVSVVI